MGKYIGSTVNPYAYTVPNAASNPVRALVFDAGQVTSVTFRVDSGSAQTMTRVATNPRLWEGSWNASGVTPGEHTLLVSAVGTTTRSHSIKVQVEAVQPPVNHAPVAVDDDSYTTLQDTALNVPAPGVLVNDSDPDGDVLSASVVAAPSHGSVSLNTNGSFVYTPAGGYSGTDSFIYAASDGQLSATATVTITVTKPTTDTVAVTAATFSQRTKVLTVSATSTSQPDVTLKAQALGPNDVPIGSLFDLNWKAKTRVYTGSSQALGAVPTSVKVTSSGGGWGTRNVQVKK
jgi:VCBS repeat-containing protein